MAGWVRRLAKITGYVILGLLILAAIALTFTVGWRPVIGAKKRALTSRKFESTPERMRRGEYLVHAVMHCMKCHSKYDEKANPPVLLSKEGSGSVLFDEGGFRGVQGGHGELFQRRPGRQVVVACRLVEPPSRSKANYRKFPFW